MALAVFCQCVGRGESGNIRLYLNIDEMVHWRQGMPVVSCGEA